MAFNGKTIAFIDLPKDIQSALPKMREAMVVSDQHHYKNYGYTSRIHSIKFRDQRIVCVNDKFLQSDDPYNDWDTPPDFLISYLKGIIGSKWLSEELEKNISICMK